MKTIVSTTGVEIEFNLSASRKILISKIPVRVSDLELRELVSRLGGQINVIEDSITDPALSEDTSSEPIPDVTPEVVDSIETPEVLVEPTLEAESASEVTSEV